MTDRRLLPTTAAGWWKLGGAIVVVANGIIWTTVVYVTHKHTIEDAVKSIEDLTSRVAVCESRGGQSRDFDAVVASDVELSDRIFSMGDRIDAINTKHDRALQNLRASTHDRFQEVTGRLNQLTDVAVTVARLQERVKSAQDVVVSVRELLKKDQERAAANQRKRRRR